MSWVIYFSKCCDSATKIDQILPHSQQHNLAFSRDFCYIPLAKVWHLACKIPRMVCASKALAFGLKKHAQKCMLLEMQELSTPSPIFSLTATVKAAICIADLWVISGHNIVKKLVSIPNRMEEWVNFLQHSGSFTAVQKVGAQQWYNYGAVQGENGTRGNSAL